MVDLAPATIRTWESRYGLVVPERSAGRQRLYSREQVDQLRFVKDLIGAGRRPSEAHRLLSERVASGAGFESTMRVLLAESQFGAAQLLRQLLGAEGFEVILASDPETAARSLENGDLTLAVVDTADHGFDAVLAGLKQRGTRVVTAESLLEQARGLGG